MKKIQRAARMMTLLIATGFLLVSSGVMGKQPNWNFGELGERLLAENPGLREASNLERAQAAFDAYMELMTKEGAGVSGTLGDSVIHTIAGERNDPTKVLNCEQHTYNLQQVFHYLQDQSGRLRREGRLYSQLTMWKEGAAGWNPLDPNRNHMALMVRDDDGAIYVFDPWLHAMDRRMGSPAITLELGDEGRKHEFLPVYDNWKSSQYRGIAIEEYANLVYGKGAYLLDSDRIKELQDYKSDPIVTWRDTHKATPPLKPIDDLIDECMSFCYGDESDAKWLVQNQYNGRMDSCYLDCINFGVAGMKQMLPDDQGGYYQLIETIANPGGADYKHQRTARIRIEVAAAWSEGSVNSTANYYFDEKPNGQFITSLSWDRPPAKIYPDVATPLSAVLTGMKTVDSGSSGGHYIVISMGLRPIICGMSVLAGAAGSTVRECKEPLTIKSSSYPKQRIELVYSVNISHMSTIGQGKYTYVYQWVPEQ